MSPSGKLDWRGPHPEHGPQELPEEWVLRQLFDTDIEDNNVLGTLLEDYGAILRPYFDPRRVPENRQQLLAPLPPPPPESHSEWWEHRSDGTIEDARWWLKTARALVGMWRNASFGLPSVDAWTTEGFVSVDEQFAWTRFTDALNIGLRPFRAHVETRVGRFDYGGPRGDLYSAACRQVFNLIVEGSDALRCENATCGRVFVHQLGGARYGQYRSKGLRFCTPECARAETQRQYRRRKAARQKEQP